MFLFKYFKLFHWIPWPEICIGTNFQLSNSHLTETMSKTILQNGGFLMVHVKVKIAISLERVGIR